jgi:N-methylhydantoinase B
MNTPIEAVESEFPVRVESYGLAQDSGGPGQFRGGLGVRRQWRILGDESVINLRTDRFKYSSPGIFGAKPARPSAAAVRSNGAQARPLTSKIAGLRLKQGDVLSLQFAGGGGWGDPREREPERVRQDVLRGYVSREAARDDYGVALADDLGIDAKETARLRAKDSDSARPGDSGRSARLPLSRE